MRWSDPPFLDLIWHERFSFRLLTSPAPESVARAVACMRPYLISVLT